MPAPWQDALEKILVLHALESTCVGHMRHLACKTDLPLDAYLAASRRLEAILKEESLPDEKTVAADPAVHDSCRSVIELARRSPRLLQRLKSVPALDTQPRELLATLLHLADLRPDPADGITTSDGPFLRILRYLNTSGTIDDVRELLRAFLRDDLAHLIALTHQFPVASDLLNQMATDATWTAQIQGVEDELDRRAQGLPDSSPAELGRAAVTLLEETRKTPASPPPTSLATLLLLHPRFSSMTREEVIGFGTVRDRYRPSTGSNLFPSALGVFSERNQYRGAADQLLRDSNWDDARNKAESSLDLRITIANHFRALRRIAKLDALERNWPELYQSLEQNLEPMVCLEGFALQPATPNQPTTVDERCSSYRTDERWSRYLTDERLLRLLRLRPFIRDINPEEFEKYKEISQQIPTSVARPPVSAFGVTEAAPPSYTALDLSISLVPSATSPTPAPLPPEEPATEMTGEPTTEPPDGVLDHFHVLLLESNGSSFTADVSVKSSDLQVELEILERAHRSQVAAVGTRDVARPLDLNETLKRIGIKLHDWFIRDEVRTRLDELLRSKENYRIFLNLDGASSLQNLPWESLYLPAREVAVTLSHRTSLVRYKAAAATATPPPFSAPLRILVVIPAPEGLPPLEGGQEKQLLQQTLSRGPVQLKFLENDKASLEETQEALRDFRPNIFQFVGHGHFDIRKEKGELIFQRERGAQRVEPDKLANLLRDSMVGLAILNGCDTGRSSSNDSLSSVAGSIVRAGVPAAIATMREVYDEAALLFSREFYRSFVAGYSLETSLVEARKALYNGNWNWSAYALFSGAKLYLDAVRLALPLNRTTPN